MDVDFTEIYKFEERVILDYAEKKLGRVPKDDDIKENMSQRLVPTRFRKEIFWDLTMV